MTVCSLPTRTEDPPTLWTRAGLAAWFHISEHAIRKYIEWGLVPPALGRHTNGFNYDQTHFAALAAIRRELEERTPLRERRRTPHVIIRAPRETGAA